MKTFRALWLRFVNLFRFQLEQLILRGALSRLFVIAMIMLLLAVIAGLFVHYWVAGFEDPGASIWWAFLRLTDTGYLGDDRGTLLRTVSTILTVLGAVLFLGALIAIMTQWLNETIASLEQGFTPIAQNNHVLILGWTNRTTEMVAQLVGAEGRVKRFLRHHGGGPLKIVILADRVGPALVQELKDRLGSWYDPRQITLRSGSPLRLEHLLRVDYLHAAAILLPAREFGGAAAPDEATVKTLMSAAHSGRVEDSADLPLIVAELFDAAQLQAARRAYPGPAELIGTGLLISRLMAQNTRHRGLSRVCSELLSDSGNQVFVRDFPQFVGQPLAGLMGAFDNAVLLGVTRRRDSDFQPLYADPDYLLAEGDRLALIATDFDSCAARRGFKASAVPEISHESGHAPAAGARRVLVLGWNQKVPALIDEFDAYTREEVALDLFSMIDESEREKLLARRGIRPTHARIRHLEGDFTSRFELAGIDPADYDNIILVASDWLDTAEQADARTLLGYLVLSELLEVVERPPAVLVEAMSPDNAGLFDAPNVELLVSPDLQNHLLTQVALRRELHWVMEELFGAGGAEIAFRSPARAALDGSGSFRELQRHLAGGGEILLGVFRRDGGSGQVVLNPPRKDRPLSLSADDELIVMDVV